MATITLSFDVDDKKKKEWKKAIIAFVNLGLMVIILGVFVFSAVAEFPVPNELWAATKLVLLALSGILVIIGVLAWDIIAGINIIEQKLKDIEEKTKIVGGEETK